MENSPCVTLRLVTLGLCRPKKLNCSGREKSACSLRLLLASAVGYTICSFLAPHVSELRGGLGGVR
eukprot:3172022-Pleurochrysis_carterae.AAC.1